MVPAAKPGKLMAEKQILSFKATNIPSACRIANIALNGAMILPYNANLGRMAFSEGTAKSGYRLLHRLVCSGDESWWNHDAKFLGCFLIDD